MKTSKSIDIVGCGIVGLVTAVTIKNLIPDSIINIYDAGTHPLEASELIGTTFGKGRDARQFTGSESLSFQNPVHARALRLAPGEHKDWAGWRLISEENLTDNEKRWRSESASRFVATGHENLNEYDDLHAQFNYAGMAAWEVLEKQLPYLSQCRISNGPVSVFFLTEKNFKDDLDSESNFLKKFGDSATPVYAKNIEDESEFNSINKELIYEKLLQLPGSAWRIRSLGLKIISDLEQSSVKFHWNKEIISTSELNGDTVIWTVGTTHKIPDIYRKNSLIQGIAGCWVSIPNPGFIKPFKISLPQPSGYINITPDNEILHISGGFGWVGERPYHEAYELMKPIVSHFKKHISKYFEISIKEMDIEGEFPISICIRPSSPTGLPDVRSIMRNNQKNIILTGSGKSGSIQAPLLALYALNEIAPQIISRYVIKSKIKNAISQLESLYKIHMFGNSTDYPEFLEKDLFG